ncbi:MAG: TorF family putative porin [Alphaproteobacteria bacterium]|nr:TorF family putative porin [Alphaproteobacteria bacterium]MBU1516057.1 TorF family putative porin [Alphaproteobacteria bacterium]MBU2092728.1 TorF family putative porin [Alphaproteobacteria bacterium]MBU2153747.1 TorF family putative porin [Alphaproteobacteria bacterium]MBU2308375.1 TorF family putative porin [Alphaproteobacteria bacterium]
MNLRPISFPLAALALASIAGPAAAQELSFNVGAASDYVFRGVSQTDGNAQVFAGADLSMGDWYAGVWASNVDFNDGTDAEFDVYGGYTTTLGIASLDFGVLYYAYVDPPAGPNPNYFELQAKASVPVGPATLGGQLYFTPDYYGSGSDAWYYEVNGAYSPTDAVTFSAALGREEIADGGSYTTWNAGVGYALTDNLAVDLRYHDTDRHSLGKTYGNRAVVSLKATF